MSFLSSLLCCCSGSVSDDEITERTALLGHGIIPEESGGSATSAQQLAEQDALRRILDHATDRFVNIDSPSPFSRSTPASPTSSRASSPTRSHDRPPSTWRAPTDAGPVHVVHLGTHFEPSEMSTPRKGQGKGKGVATKGHAQMERPTSAHSLKTLPRGSGNGNAIGVKPSPLGLFIGEAPAFGEDEQEEVDESRRSTPTPTPTMRSSSKYDTTNTFMTANEGDALSEEEVEGLGQNNGKRPSARGKLKDIWKRDEASSVNGTGEESTEDTMEDDREGDSEDDTQDEEEAQDELATALKKLNESMETFTLTDVGPLVEHLAPQK